MFKSKSKASKETEEGKAFRKVKTETVEKTGGVQTTTTTITCTKDNFDTAFKKLNLDPQKFQSGGTSITRQIIYTNSDGQKEVIEETVETYGEEKKHTEKPNSKSFAERLGLSKSKPQSTKICESTEAVKAASSSIPVKTGNFEEECLEAHNAYRKLHGVPSLSISKEICSYSKEWADHLAANDLFEHRKERKYGENIFMKWSSDPNHLVTGKEAVESWYSEIKDYTFGQEPRTLKSGHFTQVIWKESKKMGVAWARSKSGKVLVVANYDPLGNFVGKFTENVPPLMK